jgi:hypothetical protein
MCIILSVDSCHIGECLDESGRSPSSAGNSLAIKESQKLTVWRPLNLDVYYEGRFAAYFGPGDSLYHHMALS